MLHLPALLDPATVRTIRALIDPGPWEDGRATAGHLSASVKANSQLPEDCASARQAGDLITSALERDPRFISAALPVRSVPPLFNRYGVGEAYGAHVDGAIRPIGPNLRLRTDLSATIFLTDPADYDGGELVIQDAHGIHAARFAAGDMLLYDGGTIHEVRTVTRGCRISAFLWIQSAVRDPAQRNLLKELDTTIQTLTAQVGQSREILELTTCYHALVRMWGEV
jgi:PKHD-type hydroxylase